MSSARPDGRGGTAGFSVPYSPGLTGSAACLLSLPMAAFVYILASRRNGTLYIRVTSDLPRRVSKHRDGLVGGFTRNYGVKMLVYFEEMESIIAAIQREKTLKHWVRRWKPT